MKILKAIFGVLVLVGVAWVLWEVVPAIFNNYQLEDVITQEARVSSYSSRSEEDIQEIIFQKAKDLNIPVNREQIKVERNGNMVSISVAYKILVDIPFHPFELSFEPSSSNKGI